MSKLVGSSKPIVDNVFDICRWDDPNVMDSWLKDVGCPEASQHPPHLNQHSTHSQTLQNQTPGHTSFHQNQHISWRQDQLLAGVARMHKALKLLKLRVHADLSNAMHVLECTQTESRATKLEPQARQVSYH